MNSPFGIVRARALAARPELTSTTDLTTRIQNLPQPLSHPQPTSDQLRTGPIRSGEPASYSLLNQTSPTKSEPLEVKKGDTIDFVVDFKGDLNSDQFKWAPIIKAAEKPEKPNAPKEPLVMDWNAKKDF